MNLPILDPDYTLAHHRQAILHTLQNSSDLLERVPRTHLSQEELEHSIEQFKQSAIRHIAIIDSATPWERAHPERIDSARKQRIARGAGVDLFEVTCLLKQFQEIKSVLKRFPSGPSHRPDPPPPANALRQPVPSEDPPAAVGAAPLPCSKRA